MGGLKEEDKNEEGYFEYSGHSNINFNWNTDSNFVVLHAGATPGYEILSAELSTGAFEDEDGSILKTSLEHYEEKEMLILHVEEENFSGGIGNQYNIRIQFKNWLAKANTGLYESSYIDEVCSASFLKGSMTILKILIEIEMSIMIMVSLTPFLCLSNCTKLNLKFRMVSDTIWLRPNLNRLDAEKLFQLLMSPDLKPLSTCAVSQCIAHFRSISDFIKTLLFEILTAPKYYTKLFFKLITNMKNIPLCSIRSLLTKFKMETLSK